MQQDDDWGDIVVRGEYKYKATLCFSCDNAYAHKCPKFGLDEPKVIEGAGYDDKGRVLSCPYFEPDPPRGGGR